MPLKVVEIRNNIEGKFECVELSREAATHLISAMYAAFAPMKLTGPTMEPPDGTQMLTLEACRDYADDFAYDEQQCRLRLSQRSWEEFDLSDAAFLLAHRFEMAQAVVAFLEAAGQQAESLGIHESPTVIARTAKLWKGLATVSQ